VTIAVSWTGPFTIIFPCLLCTLDSIYLIGSQQIWHENPLRKREYCSNFPFSALTQLVGQQEGQVAREKLGVGLLVVTIWLELCASYSSSCHHHLHHP